MKMNKKLSLLFALLLFVGPATLKAQTSEAEDLDVIEMEIDRGGKAAPAPPKTSGYAQPGQPEGPRDNTLSDFSGLGGLAPFKEVSVIQKRFMPKTKRFQLFGGGTILTNNPWFTTLGASLKGSYFFSETWGVELNYMALSTNERDVTKELKSIQNIGTESLTYPKQYIGADIMWVPIYGKMTWFNNRIVPFDLYFSGGYGTTLTKDEQNAGTLHLATGQIFAITKGTAFRWDFSWNFFNATTDDKKSNSFNNLFLTVGMSWFFPEAKYR
jgi:outer membrane beta-barrel protein